MKHPYRHRALWASALAASVMVTAAACGTSTVGTEGAAPSGVTGPPPRGATAVTPASSADVAYPTMTVTDANGPSFQITAQAVTGTVAINVDGQPRYAPPGYIYLVENLSVGGPTGGAVALGDFHDPDTGLSPSLELGLDPATAAAHGYGATCGVEPGDPPSLCPITLGQGLLFDSSASPACSSLGTVPVAATQAPTACPNTLVLSYGPVPGNFPLKAVSVWFRSPPLPPQKLSS
ncbi:MAG TPA: hypothetical protein VKR22_05210 [Acidimicrobiales bacterium]|nr:hypothetical protein [Acidimicrobiales bacterium]